MAENNIFVLDDGTKELTIVNKYQQEICKLRIRTGDISIIDRFQDMTNGFDEIVAPLKDVHMKEDGTSDFEADWEIIKGVERDIIDRLNAIFDTQDIQRLFESRNAFTTINGEFYVEKVLAMLGDVVSKEIEAETKKSAKRVNKYTKDLK